jgi:hypothetical protein
MLVVTPLTNRLEVWSWQGNMTDQAEDGTELCRTRRSSLWLPKTPAFIKCSLRKTAMSSGVWLRELRRTDIQGSWGFRAQSGFSSHDLILGGDSIAFFGTSIPMEMATKGDDTRLPEHT